MIDFFFIPSNVLNIIGTKRKDLKEANSATYSICDVKCHRVFWMCCGSRYVTAQGKKNYPGSLEASFTSLDSFSKRGQLVKKVTECCILRKRVCVSVCVCVCVWKFVDRSRVFRDYRF